MDITSGGYAADLAGSGGESPRWQRRRLADRVSRSRANQRLAAAPGRPASATSSHLPDPARHNGPSPRPPESGRADQAASRCEVRAANRTRSLRCPVLFSPRPRYAFDRPCDPRSLLRPLAPPHRSAPPRPEATPPRVCARDFLARPRIPEPLPQRRFAHPEVDPPSRGAFFWLLLSWAEASTSIPAGSDGSGRETPTENGRTTRAERSACEKRPQPSGIDRQRQQTDLVSGAVRDVGGLARLRCCSHTQFRTARRLARHLSMGSGNGWCPSLKSGSVS